MSFPPQSHLPKPPPKAAPGARGPVSGAPGLPPRAAASVPGAPAVHPPAAAPARTPAAAAAAAATAAAASAQPATPRRNLRIDIKKLPANLGPMVEAIHIYDELLTEENDALKSGDAKSVESLLDRKMAATRLYQERLRNLLADAQCTRGLTPDQRSEVVTMVKELEERAKENTLLLKANMSAIEQVFEVINTAARKMRRQEVAYSKAGMVCENYNRHGVSLAYNSTI